MVGEERLNHDASAPGSRCGGYKVGMETMRASGEHTGGPKGYTDADRREFANALDRWLAKNG